jgi:hypothetical protein
MVTEIAPLTVPEIAVVDTPYDIFERNRQALIEELESGNLKQAHGTWNGDEGARCILQVAYDKVN